MNLDCSEFTDFRKLTQAETSPWMIPSHTHQHSFVWKQVLSVLDKRPFSPCSGPVSVNSNREMTEFAEQTPRGNLMQMVSWVRILTTNKPPKDNATNQKLKDYLITLSWDLLKLPGSLCVWLCVCVYVHKLKKHFWKMPPIFQIELKNNF